MRSSAVFGGHRPQQWHGDHVRPQTDVDLGRAEHRVVGGDDHVARAREAEAACQGVAAHARDDRFAERPHVAKEVGEQSAAFVCAGRAVGDTPAAEVGSRTKRLVAGAGEHDDADLAGLTARVIDSRNPCITPNDMALRRSGRLIVTRATPASTS